MIDINQPVKQGQDMILNYKDGDQRLGSASGYAREARKGLLVEGSLPPNDNPHGDVNPPDSYENHVMLITDHDKTVDSHPPKRGADGKFVKS